MPPTVYIQEEFTQTRRMPQVRKLLILYLYPKFELQGCIVAKIDQKRAVLFERVRLSFSPNGYWPSAEIIIFFFHSGQ